jgi:monolysocardiolipin acyltransferase
LVNHFVGDFWAKYKFLVLLFSGMDELLPNVPPYVPKPGRNITYNFGSPIDLRDTIAHVKNSNLDDVEGRKYITDKIQEKMFELRDETEKLHKK